MSETTVMFLLVMLCVVRIIFLEWQVYRWRGHALRWYQIAEGWKNLVHHARAKPEPGGER